jgi:hypothetical protein
MKSFLFNYFETESFIPETVMVFVRWYEEYDMAGENATDLINLRWCLMSPMDLINIKSVHMTTMKLFRH